MKKKRRSRRRRRGYLGMSMVHMPGGSGSLLVDMACLWNALEASA
jgi:hypothetical protein